MKKSIFIKTGLVLILFLLSAIGCFFVLAALLLKGFPDVDQMRGCITTTMYQVNLCPQSPKYVRYNQISSALIDAIIASEDAAFFQHQGFDWYEIKKSVDQNIKLGGYKRGASTITQQLAKNVFLSKEKSLWRKVKEALITYQIEKKFSKKEILERYLNVVEWGPGIFGIKDSARYYFNKQPSQLNFLESAFLAFLLPNPKDYHKNFIRKSLSPFATKAVKTIVHRLVNFKKISAEQEALALKYMGAFPWAGIDFQEVAATPLNEESTPFEPTQEQLDKVYEEESTKLDEDSAVSDEATEEETL
ncbi:MAG: monofunctional biosynthetic peptidoglycan transglycosylase [Bdellovibrionales bacterium]|nr:monofunctional biosynthetic peptidoglycan transglycosylase [Bdellovibrionales bacterium]